MMAQLIGYVATFFLALSLIVTKDLQFRWFNTLGCISFIVYGALIGAFPVMLTNTILLIINAWHLYKMYRFRAEEDFELITWEAGSPLVAKFRRYYAKDLEQYFPGYAEEQTHNLRFMVLRDMQIANVFAGTLDTNGCLHVALNYTAPRFRDYQVGRFLFDKGRHFLEAQGIRSINYQEVTNEGHAEFLRRNGFSAVGKGYTRYL